MNTLFNRPTKRERFGKRCNKDRLLGLFIGVAGMLATHSSTVLASDHDDGETSFKSRNLNLTDLYTFVESWQDSEGSSDNLILVMNTNPRSLAQQQYAFNTRARYSFHLSQVADDAKTLRPTGNSDVEVRFTFGSMDRSNRQSIDMTLLVSGIEIYSGTVGTTTSLADAAASTTQINSKRIAGSRVRVFAGLREDPFFFDVERYFRIRSLLAGGSNTLGSGPIQGGPNVFRSDATAVDFTAGYNVNSIVVSLPLKLINQNLRSKASQRYKIFDVWETIGIPGDMKSGLAFEYRNTNRVQMTQKERLGRPGINEALVLTDKRLAQFNEINPNEDLSDKAASVRKQVVAVLTAVNQYAAANELNPPAVADVATGFLPDVMRIDTSKNVAVGTAAYNSDFVIVNGSSSAAMLTGGRKIEDDVIDITLSYLLNSDPTGASVKDGVSYAGGTTCATAGQGSNPGNPGHRCLNGQSTRLGSATFPFLATPQ